MSSQHEKCTTEMKKELDDVTIKNKRRKLSSDRKLERKKKIRRQSSSSSSSTSSSESDTSSSSLLSSSSSSYETRRKKCKVSSLKSSSKLPKSESRKHKLKKKLKHKRDKFKKDCNKDDKKKIEGKADDEENDIVEVPVSLMSKSMAPMTKEQWEKQQSVVRKVFDETTGRHRLIKGDGEVIEEMVSRDRHKMINKQATMGDGAYFQANVYKK